MSLHREDDLQSSRSSEVTKLENLNLHKILLDEVPSIDISDTRMGLHALPVTFDVYNNAVALCEGAHLANLKAYSMTFMSLLTTQYDAESRLRSPTITKAQNADKMISGNQDLGYPSLQFPLTRVHSKAGLVKEVENPRKVRAHPRRRTKEKEGARQPGFRKYALMVNGNPYALVSSQANAVFGTVDSSMPAPMHPKPDGTACGGKRAAVEDSSTPH